MYNILKKPHHKFSNYYEEKIQRKIEQLLPADILQPNKQFYLRDKPSHFDEKDIKRVTYMTIKENKKIQLDIFNKILNDIYNNDKERLVSLAQNTKSKTQQIFKLNSKITKMNFRSIEISCRMMSYFEANTNTTGSVVNNENNNVNLNRISNIKFKGEFGNVIQDLLEKCLEEIVGITDSDRSQMKIFSPAAYVSSRCSDSCTFPCLDIEKATCQRNSKCENLFSLYRQKLNMDSLGDDKKNPVCCFYRRQLLGTSFFPYISEDEDNDDDGGGGGGVDNNILSHYHSYYTEEVSPHTTCIFDNFYIQCSNNILKDLNASILGVENNYGSYDDENFLTGETSIYSALIDFNMERIGLSGNGIVLYLNLLQTSAPVYYTNVNNANAIISAKEHLTNLCFEKDIYKNYLLSRGLVSKESFITKNDDAPGWTTNYSDTETVEYNEDEGSSLAMITDDDDDDDDYNNDNNNKDNNDEKDYYKRKTRSTSWENKNVIDDDDGEGEGGTETDENDYNNCCSVPPTKRAKRNEK